MGNRMTAEELLLLVEAAEKGLDNVPVFKHIGTKDAIEKVKARIEELEEIERWLDIVP